MLAKPKSNLTKGDACDVKILSTAAGTSLRHSELRRLRRYYTMSLRLIFHRIVAHNGAVSERASLTDEVSLSARLVAGVESAFRFHLTHK